MSDPAVHIGYLTLEILIPAAGSLKERRFVVKSVVERIRSRFHVSCAEIGAHDLWQRSVIGIVSLSNDKKFLNGMLDKIADFAGTHPEAQLIRHDIQFI